MIIGLAVQYILGTIINLYTTFPQSGGPQVMWKFAKSQPVVFAHIIWGTLLFLGAVVFLVRAVRQKNLRWKVVTTIGFIAVLVSWISGERFVSTQNNIFSLIMAIGFMVAVVSYSFGLYQ